MGFVAETAILKATEKAAAQAQRDSAALLAAQLETNRLLGLLLQAMATRAPQAPGTTTWGRD